MNFSEKISLFSRKFDNFFLRGALPRTPPGLTTYALDPTFHYREFSASLIGSATPQIRSDCVHKWERTVMGISVHTAETEMATTPYYMSWHALHASDRSIA